MIIGITGGVGAGKSTVMTVLREEYGVYTIFADDVAKDLQKTGGLIYFAIVSWLGEEILLDNRELNREKLASIVFSDKEKLQHLNEISHPIVRKTIEGLIHSYQKLYKHIAVEAALLIEEHYEDICDEFWFVDANDDIRVERLMKSRGYTKEKCYEIIKNQLPRQTFLEHCKRVIDNGRDEAYLKEQLRALFREI